MQELSDYLTADGWKKDWYQTRVRHPKIASALEKTVNSCNTLYRRRIVNVNLNVMLAAYPSIEAAAYASQRMEAAQYSPGVVSTGAAIADWLAYVPVHVGLHYLANKENFKDEHGKFQHKEFWKDTGRVYLTALPSIGLFYAIAGPVQYAFMQSGIPGDMANRLSYWGTMAVTRAVHTVIGLRTGLFKDQRIAPDAGTV